MSEADVSLQDVMEGLQDVRLRMHIILDVVYGPSGSFVTAYYNFLSSLSDLRLKVCLSDSCGFLGKHEENKPQIFLLIMSVWDSCVFRKL